MIITLSCLEEFDRPEVGEFEVANGDLGDMFGGHAAYPCTHIVQRHHMDRFVFGTLGFVAATRINESVWTRADVVVFRMGHKAHRPYNIAGLDLLSFAGLGLKVFAPIQRATIDLGFCVMGRALERLDEHDPLARRSGSPLILAGLGDGNSIAKV